MSAQSINDGGPAFPYEDARPGRSGMALRDYFAAKAMVAVFMSVTTDDKAAKALREAASVDRVSNEQHIAVVSYRMADAMLKARKQ